MEYLMNNFVVEYLKHRITCVTKSFSHGDHTISKGESSIDEIIGEMETLSNPLLPVSRIQVRQIFA